MILLLRSPAVSLVSVLSSSLSFYVFVFLGVFLFVFFLVLLGFRVSDLVPYFCFSVSRLRHISSSVPASSFIYFRIRKGGKHTFGSDGDVFVFVARRYMAACVPFHINNLISLAYCSTALCFVFLLLVLMCLSLASVVLSETFFRVRILS